MYDETMAPPETLTLSDGRTLAYASYGDPGGTPLVFHHGVPGSCVLGSVFDDAARAQGVRVIAPSRPGYGGSDPHETTLKTWATDCNALADYLALDSFAVCGFSGGGPFALAVAERSQRVSAVGVVSAIVPESDGGALDTLARVPPALSLAFRATGWLARLRGPEFARSLLTTESIAPETESVVHEDLLTALDGRPTGAVREWRLFTDDWSLPIPTSVPIHAYHGVEDTNVSIEPVRMAYTDHDATLTELDTDHLGALLHTVPELTKKPVATTV